MNPLPSPALVALRSSTASLHAALDRSMRIGLPGAGRSEYASYVAALWGWLAPLEPLLWAGPWPEAASPAERAVKASWLESDIRAARADGYLAGEIATLAPAARFDSLSSRAGWAYVIEGSMLGAAALRHRLGTAIDPWPARWLQGYGTEGPARWREFLAFLGQHIVTPAEIDRCTQGAQDAFASIADWMRLRGATA